jgi:hypothetical protein
MLRMVRVWVKKYGYGFSPRRKFPLLWHPSVFRLLSIIEKIDWTVSYIFMPSSYLPGYPHTIWVPRSKGILRDAAPSRGALGRLVG